MLLSLYDWSWGRARAKAFRGSNLWRCYCLIRRDLVSFTPLALRIAWLDCPLFFENQPLLLCVFTVSFFISNNVSFVFDVVTPFNYSIIHFGSGICLFCFSVSFALFLCRNCDTSIWVCACFFNFIFLFFMCLDPYTVVLHWVFCGFFPSIAAVNFCSWWLFMNNNCFV